MYQWVATEIDIVVLFPFGVFVIYYSPSSIDAYVFGRLWPLLNYDRTCRKQGANINHRLISHIYQCENLLQLCRRVQRHCFPTATSTIRSCELSVLSMSISIIDVRFIYSDAAELLDFI